MLLVGPAGSGKTHTVLAAVESAIREGRSDRVKLIVPTASMAQHLVHILARRGLSVPGAAVQTIADFVAGLTPGVQTPSAATEAWLLDRSMEATDLPALPHASRGSGLSQRLAATIREFQAAGCSARQAQHLAASPLQDAFCAVYRNYESRLQRSGFSMQRTREAASRIQSDRPGSLEEIYLDGFLDLSPAEKELVQALADSGVQLTLTLPWAGRGLPGLLPEQRLEDLHRSRPSQEITSAPNPRAEIEEVARRILALEKPYRQIGVVLRSQQLYGPLIQSVFERFHIPFRIRMPTPLAHHGLVRYLRLILSVIATEPPAEWLLSLIKSPYCPLRDASAADGFDFDLRRSLPGAGLAFALNIAARHPPVKAYLESLSAFSGWDHERHSPRRWAEKCGALRATLVKEPAVPDGLEFPHILELRGHASAAQQFEVALQETAELPGLAGPRKVDLAAYLRALDHVLAHTHLRVSDQRRNVVQVLSVYEARQWELPVVFVCGLAEGLFPKRHSADLFFSEADRERLKLNRVDIRTRRQHEEEEQRLFTIAASRATEQLILSYPRSGEDGKPLLRSFLLTSSPGEDLAAPSIRVSEQPASFRGKRPNSLGNPELLQAIRRRVPSFSASSLEDYLQCPFRFFARKSLNLHSAPVQPERRIDPLLMGDIVHLTIARWSKDGSRSIHEVLDEVFAEKVEDKHVPAGFQTAVMRLNLEADLGRFVQEGRLDGLSPVSEGHEEEFEYAIGDPGRDGFLVRGRVDRYLALENGLGLVIDYKYSSDNRVRDLHKEHREGRKVQAQLYLMSLEKKWGLRPAAMRFLGLREKTAWMGWVNSDLIMKEHHLPKEHTFTGPQFQRLLTEAEQLVREKVDEIRSGNIAVSPKDTDTCKRFCDYRDVCRF